ncbi:beta-lactamase/transpeptidase-like protein [Aspergillus multicolor]|uniref:serine hydrolase domain-containing protein n=1 Tax=Aspergillus multicolor TaxID=41759 RepID=UPI003CCCAB2E
MHSAEAPGTLEFLRLLSPTIQDICISSGTSGLSLGVLHHGSVVFRDSHGYRDVEAQLKPDSDAVYGVASLTKAFTACLIGILVDGGKRSWDEPVHSVLPGFQRDDEVKDATITDFLTRQTGIARSNQYWFADDNELLLKKDQIVPMVNSLRSVQPFRSAAAPSNWNFALAGEVVEFVTGESWADTVKSRLLDPLGLTRTTFWADNKKNIDNLAKPYLALDDGSSHPIPYPQITKASIMSSAMGLRSTVNDVLTWKKALLTGLTDQRRLGRGSAKDLPIKNLLTIMQGRCQLTFSYPEKMAM